MEPKWDNVFTNQRQRTSGSTQLENNVTKNLLKLIQDTDGEVIRELTRDGVLAWGPDDISSVSVETQQGLGDYEQAGGNTPYLLGISRDGKHNLNGASDEERTTNIVDGVVNLESLNATLFIEVKTGGSSLSGSQLLRYARELGIADDPDALERTSQFKTLTWRSLYGTVSRIEERTSDEISEYLHREFAKFLEYEQLETTLASNDGDYRKRLRLQRCRDPDHRNWDAGELLFNLRWEDENSTSNVGKMSATSFNQLLGGIADVRARQELKRLNIDEKILEGIPADVRKAIFAGESVSFKPLEEWVFDTYSDFANSDSGTRTISTSAPLPDGNTRRFNVKYRDKEHRAEGQNINLRYVRYGEKNNYHQQVEAILDPTAFEDLFNSFPQEIRVKAFCGEPAVDYLWGAYLNDELK